MTEQLHLVTGDWAGEPVRLVGSARGGRRSEFAVDRERGFERDEGRAVLDEVGEGFIEIAGGLLEDAHNNFNVGGAKSLDALSADLRVGILRGDDAAGDTGGD